MGTLFDNPLRPNIIPPTAGDLEEARIRRLMDLAKLHQLQLDPQFEQRKIDLASRGLDLQQKEAQARQALGSRGQEIDIRGQDVQMRGQDMSSAEHAAALKASTINNILSHAASRPDIPLSVYAETAKQFGFPEVANSFKMAHEETQNEKAAKLGAGLIAAKKSGDQQSYMQTLDAIKTHPESADLLPRIKSSIPKEYENLKVDLDPTKPGVQTKAPTANVGEFLGETVNLPLALRRIGNTAEPLAKKSKKLFSDFYSGATR